MCIRDGFFRSNTTSYIVNHSTEAFEVFDRSDCTGNNLLIQPRSWGGVPDSWNDKISSVQRVRGIET